jgi:predicted metal-dependent hydrolase
MRIVDVGGRLVVVAVRESSRAQHVRVVYRRGEPPELVVPRGTSDRAVDRALLEHRDWIARQLTKDVPPVLELDRLALSAADGRRLARSAVAAAAEREAPRLGVTYSRITIRDQRTLWGSCSSAGALSFNWRLILAPLAVLEYVVVHELCHLRIRGHSPRFWRLVERARPMFREERDWLRDHGWELLAYRPAS